VHYRRQFKQTLTHDTVLKLSKILAMLCNLIQLYIMSENCGWSLTNPDLVGLVPIYIKSSRDFF